MSSYKQDNLTNKTEGKLAGIILLFIGIFSAFVSFEWSFFTMLLKRRKNKESLNKKRTHIRQMEINHPRNRFEEKYEKGKQWCKDQKMSDHYITSDDGLRLHAYLLEAKNPKRIVILSHGYRGSGFGDFANIAKYLYENGCTLLFVEQRCCGESEGQYITFGAKEHRDIVKWTYYIEKRNKNHLPVFLFGTSMGGTSVIMASGEELPDSVKGYIIDCAFHSMKKQLKQLAGNWFHIHYVRLFLFRIDILCRLFAGFKMSDADTSRALSVNTKPMLFIHGALDTFVSPDNMLVNFSKCRAPKQLVLMDEARHLCSAYTDEEVYREKIMHFFEVN